MLAADFDFNLPRELIAQTPADPRDSAKLLQLNRVTGEVSHHVFHELDQLLGDDVVLVFNQTKVEPRRLLGHKDPTGGSVEVMALEPCRMEAASLTPGMQSLLQVYADTWECLVHPGLSPGQKVLFQQGNQFLQAMVFGATEEGTRWIGFDAPLREHWDQVGVLPIPPYIHDYHGDSQMYQTVYAKSSGSIAAPTAGLHFTEGLLQRLRERGLQMEFLTLHVARDTAFPIMKATEVDAVKVHSEWVNLPEDVAMRLNHAKAAGKKIIAVGTTSVRTLEGIAAMDDQGALKGYQGPIALFIKPGHEFKLIDGMITNFHVPRSSLVMLVSAFVGREKLLAAYQEAVLQKYRFFSFGDACLIW